MSVNNLDDFNLTFLNDVGHIALVALLEDLVSTFKSLSL